MSSKPSQITEEKITEEEVSFYKEQEICLVCKGKVEGFNIFVCPSCRALYCQNCAKALSKLENMCWVCNAPIDKTKPYKPYEEEEEEVVIEEKVPKKGKKEQEVKKPKTLR